MADDGKVYFELYIKYQSATTTELAISISAASIEEANQLITDNLRGFGLSRLIRRNRDGSIWTPKED